MSEPISLSGTDHDDVIIIGSGAGGGTLAHRLAPTGKRGLILERGDWLPREVQNWDATAVFVDNRYVSPDTWYAKDGNSFQPQIDYNVGGATKLYGAALYRLRERDFGELHHFDGISPAWPVPYDEFEPYYQQAEDLYQVHGNRGEDLYQVHGNRGEDPTEPPSTAPYPHPAVSNEPRIQQLFDNLAKIGLAPFHAPCGILLDEANPAYSACIRCATCDGFTCLVHAKSDAEVIAVRPALEHPNVTLLRNAHVLRLHTDDAGRSVTSVVARVDGETQQFPADVVVVSAGAANSAKLLLGSANHMHPNGLASGSDQVGRNDLFHNSLAFLAVSLEKNPTRFQKTLGVNDFDFAVHGVDFWLSTEDLPHPDNRVTLGADGNTVLSYTSNDTRPLDELYARVKNNLNHLGLNPHHLIPRNAYIRNEIPIAGVAHQAGTSRFGSDPQTSVLDVNCKAHELDNLDVVDTSFFSSIGAVNPSLTAAANALRVGDRLIERLG